MLTSSLGHVSVTEVDGTTFTGLYAADGSLNVYDATSDTVPNGLYHPCGAMNITITDGTTLTGRYANNGSLYVVIDSTQYGVYHSCGAMNITGLVVSGAASFLSEYGPYGMVMDFTDASIAIDDVTDVLNYTSIGQVSSGALLGPGAKLTYTAPSLKNTEQADGFIKFQAHNLYLNSASPANQSVTTGMLTGATYAITLTGSVSITLSGAATGTITAGTTTFTAASGTLTCGSTSGSGTVHLRRTPSVDTYVATAGAQVYDLPYVYSSGVRTGIMVEPAATNLNTNSIDPALWTAQGTTVTAGAGFAPDGTSSLKQVVATAGNARHARTSNGTSGASGTHTASVFIKRVNHDFIQLAGSSGGWYANFNIATGATGTTGGARFISSEIRQEPNGWYRLIVVFTGSTDTVWVSIADSASAGLLPFVTAAGTEAFVPWNLQIETGTVATSPIITYGSTVLRAADNISIDTGLVPHTATEGTLYAQYVRKYDLFSFAAQLDDGTNANSIALVVSDTADSRNLMSSGGALQANIGNTHAPTGVLAQQAISWASNRANNSTNGSIGTEDTSVTVPTVNTIRLGDRVGGGRSMTGVISKIAYFPERKADAVLQTMTGA